LKKKKKNQTAEPFRPAELPVFSGFHGFLPVLSQYGFAHQPDRM
jgi:hypothetical protein